MQEILAAEEIVREIIERYNKRPLGWQVASDLKGNTIVVGPDSGYRLKTMMISPLENISFGIRFEPKDLSMTIDTGYSFGFRPVSIDLFERLSKVKMIDSEVVHKVIGKILESDPMPLDSLGSGVGGVLGGPFLQHPDLRAVSKAQKELDEKLRVELEKEFIKRYPMRAAAYR